ncbi:unnamed protein product [Heligmosomoides polygyrus]|uniref:Reverse transcriptase domain-containing protein n=1 Tax=Heligmosomoides polygyrus TaxID=6339 RepID=A0A183FN89_HELPZ|nr:unnamed protein product [Heligmosomoides polygyrus]
MKIFERILDGRIDIVQLSSNQCDFVAGCVTVDAIHAARLLIEKSWNLDLSGYTEVLHFPPLLFVVVMDAITRDLQRPVPCFMLMT